MAKLAESIALITGRASGIGKIMGCKCLQREHHQLTNQAVTITLFLQTITQTIVAQPIC